MGTLIGVAAAMHVAAAPAAATPTIPRAQLRAIRVLLRSFVPAAAGVEVFTTEVQRTGGHWLVASMAASAQFAGPGGPATITAQPDFAPHIQPLPHRNNLSGRWVLVPIALISVPLIGVPLGLFLLWRRDRVPRPDAEARERAFAPWQ